MIADWASTADALGLDYKDGIIDGELVGAVLRLQAERDKLKNLRDAAHTRYCQQIEDIKLIEGVRDQLYRWMNTTELGGWSTHLQDPMRDLAAKIGMHMAHQSYR